VLEAGARHDEKAAEKIAAKVPKDAWDYILALNGEATRYSKEKITLAVPGPCGEILKIASGTVEVDRKKNTVSIDLKVEDEGRVVAFKGNGVFPIQKEPNPQGAANGRQPSGSDTNRTSGAAASPRSP
jgi:hypothetical protein